MLRHIGTRSLQIPPNIDVLYCEQEVVATDDSALQTVLMADAKRTELLKEESDLLAAQNKGRDVTERLNEVCIFPLIYIIKECHSGINSGTSNLIIIHS